MLTLQVLVSAPCAKVEDFVFKVQEMDEGWGGVGGRVNMTVYWLSLVK